MMTMLLLRSHLKLNHLSLLSLITTQFKSLASFDRFHGNILLLVLAVGTFHLQDDLLSGLSLLVKDRFGLTTITGLFSVISSSTLTKRRFFAFFVLGDLVFFVLAGSRTVGSSRFGDVDHFSL